MGDIGFELVHDLPEGQADPLQRWLKGLEVGVGELVEEEVAAVA